MTVTSFLNYKEYQGDGVATTFAIPFLLLNRDDLKVYIDSKLLLGGYALTGIGNPISSIVFTEAPKGKVLLQRNIDLLRDTDYQENGDLLADTLNRDFDRVYLALQGVAQDNSKSLRVPDPEGVKALPANDVRANKLLSFDSQGQPSLITIDSGSVLGLAGSLADTTEKQKGAGLVGFNHNLEYPVDTVGHAIHSVDQAIQSIDQIAMFTTQWWPDRKSIPVGYVAADGQELSSLFYPDVASALQMGVMPQMANDIWLSDPSKRGYYVADTGNGNFRLPDYNGMQPSSLGALFIRGGNGSIADGTVQSDAIRNITGRLTAQQRLDGTGTGAFEKYNAGVYFWTEGRSGIAGGGWTFDASRVVPTAEENRPINVTGCWIIKLFGSISNTIELDASKLASEYAVLSTRLSTLENRFTIIYPNEGTEIAPSNVTNNNRYIMDNPFKGHSIDCRAELLINGEWGETGYVYASPNGGYFTIASQFGDKVIIQTGNMAVITQALHAGNPHGTTQVLTTAPCRVKIWRID